jgi:hypothetical protein
MSQLLSVSRLFSTPTLPGSVAVMALNAAG